MVKLRCLAICSIEDKRAAERARERGKKSDRPAAGRLVEGQVATDPAETMQFVAQLRGLAA